MSFGKLNPGKKVLVVLTALLAVSLGGGLATIYCISRMQRLFDSVIGREVAKLNAAKELEIAVLNQKGFATYYVLDGDPKWLEQLAVHRKAFGEWLRKAQECADGSEEEELLEKIQLKHVRYVTSKEQVIDCYKSGDRDKGAELHWEVRKRFFDLYGLCEQYKEVVESSIAQIHKDAGVRAHWFSALAMATTTIALALGFLLAFVLITQILGPIRRLVITAGLAADESLESNEVTLLSSRVHGLIDDMSRTKTDLEYSRERLLQSEKMAVMGKLAADMAHSIRNPMTSIKMRLFSLDRSLELTPTQKDDFDVVSEEMDRLDNIVRNFLEFSRPPKLRMQSVDIIELLNTTLQLLQHQLERHNVEVERHYHDSLSDIQADPELLKEVLVNLIMNALEAMKEEGRLVVSVEEAVAKEIGQAVLIRLSDTGPGMPESIQKEVFEPFFSTKEDGTGLGLPIAGRIIEEHGGQLAFRSEEGKGATFIITLPLKEE